MKRPKTFVCERRGRGLESPKYLSVFLRRPHNGGEKEGLEDTSDCLGPDEKAKSPVWECGRWGLDGPNYPLQPVAKASGNWWGENQEDQNDCLGPGERAKKTVWELGGGIWKARIILSAPSRGHTKKLLGWEG